MSQALKAIIGQWNAWKLRDMFERVKVLDTAEIYDELFGIPPPKPWPACERLQFIDPWPAWRMHIVHHAVNDVMGSFSLADFGMNMLKERPPFFPPYNSPGGLIWSNMAGGPRYIPPGLIGYSGLSWGHFRDTPMISLEEPIRWSRVKSWWDGDDLRTEYSIDIEIPLSLRQCRRMRRQKLQGKNPFHKTIIYRYK